MNEFLECHIEKVSSDGSKARGGNCDTRLDFWCYKPSGLGLKNIPRQVLLRTGFLL